jgi:hypothetical protein
MIIKRENLLIYKRGQLNGGSIFRDREIIIFSTRVFLTMSIIFMHVCKNKNKKRINENKCETKQIGNKIIYNIAKFCGYLNIISFLVDRRNDV